VLHVLNGDATAAVFPDPLPGERAVWRDIMMEGPADSDIATRAAWLAPRLGVTPDAYEQRWREGLAMLARAKEHDEVVLWFERDLFCAINLWFVLARLDAPRVSLVFPEVNDDVRGLGALEPSVFPLLFEQRSALSARDVGDARALWRAYAEPDPRHLARHEPIFPFARAAIRLHCGRFPSITHGLDELEYDTLATLDDTVAFSALFRRVTAGGWLQTLGIGDVQFAAMLRDLTAGPAPLIAIDDAQQPFGRWRVSRTAAAKDVLSGRVDRLALSPLDRWLGGVHLRRSDRLWRWDAEANSLVST